MSHKVFLDLDGVLCNFVAGACKAHRKNPADLPPGLWNIHEHWGITASEFWAKIKGPSFWWNLPWLGDGRDLLSLLERRFGPENITLYTSPPLDHHGASGKARWIMDQLPAYSRRFNISPKSAEAMKFLAGPGKLLVDDSPDNVQHWIDAGGEGLVVPRPWNHLHQLADRAVSVIEGILYPKVVA